MTANMTHDTASITVAPTIAELAFGTGVSGCWGHDGVALSRLGPAVDVVPDDHPVEDFLGTLLDDLTDDIVPDDETASVLRDAWRRAQRRTGENPRPADASGGSIVRVGVCRWGWSGFGDLPASDDATDTALVMGLAPGRQRGKACWCGYGGHFASCPGPPGRGTAQRHGITDPLRWVGVRDINRMHTVGPWVGCGCPVLFHHLSLM